MCGSKALTIIAKVAVVHDTALTLPCYVGDENAANSKAMLVRLVQQILPESFVEFLWTGMSKNVEKS